MIQLVVNISQVKLTSESSQAEISKVSSAPASFD